MNMNVNEHYKGKIIYRGKPREIEIEVIQIHENLISVRLLKKVTTKLKKGLIFQLPKKNWGKNMKLIKSYNSEDFIPSFLK